MRKQIIAFCKEDNAQQHPDYDWFFSNSGDYFNDGKPIIIRFKDDDGDYTRFTPYYDGDNDVVLVLDDTIYFENDKPVALCCACAIDDEWSETFNVQIPLDFE